MPTEIDPFGLPPEQAIKWFREKGYAFSWDWRDLWQEQHSQAFTVAKVTQLDILADIRKAVDDAIANGTTLQQFRKNLRPLLEQKGWWGAKEDVDPKTGEVKEVKLGSPRRLKTIYDTNLRQANSAGRWETAQRLKQTRPYLRYVHRYGKTPNKAHARPQHQQWHDLVRLVDDPAWDHIMPMNGWGCHCKVQQLNDRDLARYGLKVSVAPDLPTRAWTNTRTGETMRVTEGVDPGFDYNPGKGRGFEPNAPLPPLRDVQNFSDLGRPSASDVGGLPAAPEKLTIPRGAGSGAATRAAYRDLFEIPEGKNIGFVVDPQNVRVSFHTDLLRYIMRKAGRVPYLPHAKATIEDPFEVWLVPYRRPDGSVELRKRYIGLYSGGERTLVVVEQDGVFNLYDKHSIDGQREGYLLYARGQK